MRQSLETYGVPIGEEPIVPFHISMGNLMTTAIGVALIVSLYIFFIFIGFRDIKHNTNSN